MECSGCKKMFDIRDLEAYGTGRHIQYLCRECRKPGQQDVDIMVIGRFAKERGKKK
jgi:hypothetical protein